MELKGLPPQLATFLFNFTDREIKEDTVDIINVLITMYDSKGNGQVNIVNQLPNFLPTEAEFQLLKQEFSKIKNEDPSRQYDILGKLG